MHTLVQPNEWVAVKLPNESIRIIQVIPNTLNSTISLGKYGSFPSNLIIERPYHLTYEVQDRRDDENFNRLRVVPASELHADVIAEENGEKAVPDESAEGDANADNDASAPTSANVVAVEDGADFTLVDKASGTVIAREGRDKIEAEARQLLTQQEIETLKKRDTDGGRDIIAKLLLSHTSLDEKTTFSLAKYKILKNKKYLRRFSVQPLYASTLGQFVLEEKEPSKIMEMRHEALALLGCWGHVHYGGEEIEGTPKVVANNGKPVVEASQLGGRWLVVDDTGGLVVASVAERMGILHQDLSQHNVGNGLPIRATTTQDAPQSGAADATPAELTPADAPAVSTPADEAPSNPATAPANGTSYPTRTYRDDFEIDLASSNTITLLHSANQPNLALLKYWNCDMANPTPTTSSHLLFNRLFPLSWLQLIEPESDTTYASFTDDIPEETLSGFKASRRGNYHRKRRRWARTRFIVDQARAGGFSGLVYLRRFSVQPLYASTLGQFVLEEKEPSKIMEMRHEALALLGCWGHVHYGGEEIEGTPKVVANNGKPVVEASQLGGRWLVVDDTGGLVVASVAERMGILHQDLSQHNVGNGLPIRATTAQDAPQSDAADATPAELTPADTPADDAPSNPATAPANVTSYPTRTYRDDFEIDLASSNTITLLHSANQPNLALLKYWNCDMANPTPTTSSHPLFNRLFPLSWLQLIEPESDTTYASFTDDIPEETLSGFKASRRGNYHRKRRRWARTRFIVDQARAGGFSGLVVASTMDPISVVRAALPLLAGGAPISIYSPTIEPLTQLADCFSKARRAAWSSNPPTDDGGVPLPDLENWPGSDDFPVNPSLLIGPNVQTSRAKRWQVLPGRTHPLMMGRGGAEGFLFTGSKAVPAEGKIEARGKTKRRKVEI
ncbi:hypothetical protein BN1723_010154 [Verticillium longisporum]|uniref:tRNA (adenine(58)-N(1))-methyltransferase non-catalytic subunit TRM6 n=1 Tax=Verticillium longisporum TaxID=100787 RepID=A0A0G4KVR7_VERLO|nr:hypothetical protein BN1723_010154 [Verticillium longisporum]